MARTMGELLPESYTAVFTADKFAATAAADGAAPGVRIFVDVGSGYGTVVRAAVESGGFDWAIGIEKYREPQAICDAMLATLPPALRGRMHFVFADFADCNLAALVRAGVVEARRWRGGGGSGGPDPPPTPPSPLPSPPSAAAVVVYVNNLAFPPGVNSRHGRQLAATAAELGGEAAGVTVVSAVPLAALEGTEGGGGGEPPSPFVARLTLGMSFNPAHDARVYCCASAP